MKLKKGFITHNTEDEHILISANKGGFSGLARSNATAAFIVEQLKHEITETELVDAVLEEYDVDRERAADGVRRVLEKLYSIGAIDD